MNTVNKVLVGTMTGLVAGVAIGLLTAPKSGRETRHQIADAAEKLKRKFKKLRGDMEAEMEELHEVFSHEISGLQDDIREKVLKLIDARKNAKPAAEPSLS